jgi:hypothetical protein
MRNTRDRAAWKKNGVHTPRKADEMDARPSRSVTSVSASFRDARPHDNHHADAPTAPRRRHGNRGGGLGRAIALSQSSCPNVIMRRIGTLREADGIEQYAARFNVRVCDRDCTTGTLIIGDVLVTGRPDGIVRDAGIVVEHKRRVFKLLHYVPLQERVQCLIYMKMFGLERAHLVETFGTRMRVHTILPDDTLWDRIVQACSRPKESTS